MAPPFLIRNSLEGRAWIPSSEPTPGQPEPLIDTQELDFIITEIYADDFRVMLTFGRLVNGLRFTITVPATLTLPDSPLPLEPVNGC